MLLHFHNPKKWKDGAYSAGVLSHYFTDPHMPFRAGQTEAEGAVHRAAEWSVTTRYDKLRDLVPEVGGYGRGSSAHWADDFPEDWESG